MSDERHEGERAFDLLDRIDLLIATLPPGDAMRRELLNLRMEISQREEIFIEARHTIEKLEEVIKKVTSPANRIGTFLGSVGKDTAHIVVGGADYYCNVDPRI
ncbi:MAG TPA: peptidase, partial [Chthoniobacterales bacterium]|nr:peptidase [Chthoniobacterales bacterium]